MLFYLGFFIFLARDVPVVRQVWCLAADIIRPGITDRIPRCPHDLPTTAYRKVSVRGFVILIHPQFQDEVEVNEAIQDLQQTLDKVVENLSPEHLAVLQKVMIWLELPPKVVSATPDSDPAGVQVGVYYHYPAATLVNMGMNPDKTGGIGILDLSAFIQDSPGQQLRIVLHELAHAYQNRKLGTDYPSIDSAYRQAVKNKLYKSVKHSSGYVGEAYALRNQLEYFAELTVAYFGRGEYYPFTRSDLAKYDPVGYRLMQEIWGKIKE